MQWAVGSYVLVAVNGGSVAGGMAGAAMPSEGPWPVLEVGAALQYANLWEGWVSGAEKSKHVFYGSLFSAVLSLSHQGRLKDHGLDFYFSHKTYS